MTQQELVELPERICSCATPNTLARAAFLGGLLCRDMPWACPFALRVSKREHGRCSATNPGYCNTGVNETPATREKLSSDS